MATDMSIANEVISTILDRGYLTKEEVLLGWSLGEADYGDLQRAVLKHNAIDSGPQRIGGFVAAKRRDKLPEPSVSESIVLGEEWERLSAARLAELLEHRELEELLGNLVSPLRQFRKLKTGADRRGGKQELASALVLKHDIDLLRDTDTRKAVARAAKIECPDKWHPGKARAIAFTQEAKFPSMLAGIPSEEPNPDFEYLEGSVALNALLPFQREVKDRLLSTLRRPAGRAIVTLPTGAGKTRVGVESIRDWLTDRYDSLNKTTSRSTVLWLAHTEELCEQAYACFKQVWEASPSVCPLLLVRFWGKYTQDMVKHRGTLTRILSSPSVLVSTPQRIANLIHGKLDGAGDVSTDVQAALGLIVVDEAHRAAAPIYQNVLDGFVLGEHTPALVGLTATPFRMEYAGDDPEEGTRELRVLFRELIEPKDTLGNNPRRKLQEMEVLAEPAFELIATGTRLNVPASAATNASEENDEEAYERIDRVLKIGADNTARRMKILEHLLPIARDEANAILYFGPTVGDAECMTFLLRAEGIRAAMVSGETRSVTRRKLIHDFRQRRVRVLCNCEVLTTGFDAPLVTHVVMARPTVSRVLYEQMVGRALRGPKFGGTKTCVIMDCEDSFRGERPELGYESFRHVWEQEVQSRSKSS
jgi:DNA repair protein RadD